MSSSPCPPGFLANGVSAGIKKHGGDDLAVILAPDGATAAAMFTRNLLRAAPLEVSRDHLRRSGSNIRGVLINAGCANAATGAVGAENARAMAAALAGAIKCDASQVLINSTGVIGVQLPVERIEAAIPALVAGAAPDGLDRAAVAIMTTDTVAKIHGARIEAPTGPIEFAGFAKGAGMIHPDLAPALQPHATMIAVLLTDATATPEQLQRVLMRVVDQSFHRVTIDGDTSTNDSVFVLASGKAAAVSDEVLERGLLEVSRVLARKIARDGEGATKLVHVEVTGAASPADALAVARTVATSLLVRTAIAGGDPNWGRIVAAVGRSGVDLEIARLRVVVSGIELFVAGAPASAPQADRERAFAGPVVHIVIDLAAGDCRDEFFTCDLTEGYVRVNATYMT